MRYACDVCGERFFVHGHMKRHLYSHTGIKPHACRWRDDRSNNNKTNNNNNNANAKTNNNKTNNNNSPQVEVWSNICVVWRQNEARKSPGNETLGREREKSNNPTLSLFSITITTLHYLCFQHSENPYKLDCDICGRPFRWR